MPHDEIDKFYKRNTFHQLLHGFITGVQTTAPSITKKEAATMFLIRYKLFDDYSVEYAILTYDRINKDLIDAERSK